MELGMVLRTLLGVPILLYLPGYLIDQALLGTRNELRGIERQLNRVVLSVLLTGWLAFTLAEIGWFAYGSLVAGMVVVCVVALFVWRRTRSGSPPERHAGPPLHIVAERFGSARSGDRAHALRLVLRFDVCLALIAIIFGLLVARPFEVVRGGLDAGVYANTGVSIARTGGIVVIDPIVRAIGERAAGGDTPAQQIASNVFGVQNNVRFMATRLRAAGFFISTGDMQHGRVVPQFFHLWPAWIAVFVAMLGPVAGLVATGAAGTLGVVLLGAIGRRLAGPVTGLLAAAFLATMGPQVWFSRMPTSEALTQALLLAGIWAFSYFATATDKHWRIWWGAIAGLALGQLALTRIDFPIALAPVMLLLLYVALTRRWHVGYTALAVAVSVMLLHSAIHIVLIARAYFIDTTVPTLQKFALTIHLSWPLLTRELQEYSIVRPGSYVGDWRRLALEVGVVGVGAVIALLLWWRPRLLRSAERLVTARRALLLNILVVALGVAAAYAYLIRPGILTPAVMRHPFTPENWLRLQGFIGAPIAIPFDLYPKKPVMAVALANMVRLGWYLSPLGVLLGVVGALRFWRRLDRQNWLLIVIATFYALFYINSLYGTQDQTYIYILRRYVPIVFPAFALGMAYALDTLRGIPPVAGGSTLPQGTTDRPGLWRTRWERLHTTFNTHPRMQRLRFATFALLAAALLLFFVVTGRTLYAHTEYAGMLDQIAVLSKEVGPDDIILLRGGGASDVAVRDTSELIAAPLTYIYGRNALPVKGRTPGKYPEAFADQVTRWRAEGRRVFLLLAASGGDMLFPGYAPRDAATWTLRLSEFQQLANQKPKLSYINEAPFHLYELVPEAEAAPATMLTADDTAAQAAGLYRSEVVAADQPRAAWTDGAAVLRLPATSQGQTVTLQVGAGTRPLAAGPANVCLGVTPEPIPYPEGGATNATPWQELGCHAVGVTTEIAVTVPDLGATGSLLLRLRSEPWVPSQVAPDPGTPQSADNRPLGILFFRLGVGEQGAGVGN